MTFRDAESPPKERAWALYGSEHMDPRFQAVIEETSGFGQTYPAKCNGKEFEVGCRMRIGDVVGIQGIDFSFPWMRCKSEAVFVVWHTHKHRHIPQIHARVFLACVTEL